MKNAIIKRYGIWVVVGLVYILTRVVRLTIIPVFADEAIYIHWAIRAWHNATERFISFSDGKPPLHTWLMIPWLKLIADPLVAGRALSTVSGLAALIGTYLLGKKLFGQNTARWVLPFALFSPFLLFYDRLAVADSLLTAFYVWSVYLTYRFLDRPDLGNFFLLVFSLIGGLLTKQPGIYGLLMIPVIVMAQFFIRSQKRKTGQGLVWRVLLAAVLAYVGYSLVIKLAPNSHLLTSRTYDYILGKREWLNHPFQIFGSNLRAIIYWVGSYQTAGWLVLLGVVPLVWRRQLQPYPVLIAAVLLPMTVSAFIGRIIFPRYFVIVQPFLNLILGSILALIVGKLSGWKKIFLILLFIPVLRFDFYLLFNPPGAPLIQREQNQYLTGWSAGYGIKDIADYLIRHHSQEAVYVYTEGFFGTLPDGLLIYLDRYPNISVSGIGQPIYSLPPEVTESADHRPTYLVVNNTRIDLKNEDETKLVLIGSFPKPRFSFLTEDLLLYQVNPSVYAQK